MKRQPIGIRWSGRPARALLPLFALLGLGVAAAEAAPNIPLYPDPVPTRAAKAIKLWSRAELRAIGGSTSGSISGSIVGNLPKGGNLIRWGGAYVVAPYLVKSAIDWAVGKGNAYINQSTINWWKATGSTKYPPYPTPQIISNMNPSYWNKWFQDQDGDFSIQGNGQGYSWYVRCTDGRNWSFNRAFEGMNGGEAAYNEFQGYHARCGAQTLNQFLDSHPEGVGDISKAVADYVETNPNELRSTLTPVPTDNQYYDNPYANLTEDGEGDGYPDYLEYESWRNGKGGDPNDPGKKPLGEPYETGRVTTTTKNPDGSTTTKTTISYSDGSTASFSKTTKTVTTKNPDGSTTITTTTTEETCDRSAQCTVKTHTDKKDVPASPADRKPVKTETTTRKNPDGSTTTTTTTTYDNGDTTTTRKTTTTSKTKNGDGTITTTTTTSTEREECTADGCTVKREDPVIDKKTEPSTDPKDQPDEQACKDSGGFWSDGACNSGDEAKNEEDCKASGGTWDGAACTPAPKSEDDIQKEDAEYKQPEQLQKPDFSPIANSWEAGWAELKEDASRRFPFGLKNPATALVLPGGEGSPCPPVHYTFLPGTTITGEINVCDNPFSDMMHNVLRPLLAWFFTGAALFASAKIASRA